MNTKRLTVAQATIEYLKNQYSERDGVERQFFAGCFGIFGHGNLAGFGQALQQSPDFRYFLVRNEQAAVHTAVGYAKMKNRLSTFVCTSSIGPGATNMITAAAGATINRLPVLLMPGDIFAQRKVAPVLQQFESAISQDISVNDCFKPVSKYWDRINRPEQLITSLPEVMRVLTSPADTGAVTLCIPQDVQAEAYDFPVEMFEKRTWHIPRPRPDANALLRAVELIQSAKTPMIIAGGGVIYSEAESVLKSFVQKTGIPVGETFAGKGSLRYDDPHNLGATGATGTEGANAISTEADVVIGIGTRYSDFTTASKTAFQNKNVKFININITEFDAHKHSGLALTGDAKVILEELTEKLETYKVDDLYRKKVADFNKSWDEKVALAYKVEDNEIPSQAEVIGAVNEFIDARDVVLNASGSAPGDLHKLWRTRDSKGFHLEYGYSCMGYEISGGLGAKMACPDREIYVILGDGGYLMMPSEIITSLQEGYKLTIVLIDNNGFASIGGLSKSIGSEGFGTKYLYRDKESGILDGDTLPVDLAKNAESLGAKVLKTTDIASFNEALKNAKKEERTTVVYIETVPERKMAGYGHAWWDVPIAEVSKSEAVQKARENYVEQKKNQRYFF
ncbi:MAG: 3D-(3,5/4)-trihydroxycyclohexane-1,2-dione acylhydrolase (decyclizing) [Prolixibacteraceae bacterium]|jgi:3D-(3,5/4)-trihydroxycyclohexane-1,2-dione acylhydrolase (decyclizing)|nr:3D-(3,5/4)-trihydroxycyclohexane-1,2-dione acylhydrolase (decyclizing) [Prolixibacteraceae bacterium]MBT6766666.1 3D-(3,5/4)-trihydroxycyclohexane-1,2-dione acylhydrolase (decyclizing) [Prolixibacteraceae bacterium]MBT6998768.1 3D-(3,5/4)-trihydroxycyclohexane-1,2-dione acylhydrolase (decyclizing) [Prolixibacteraceae bacterium]MBT7393958.1 3D-(3,5/4)-trihydroxycyclohexane-1,2-dione acylhydrolase (decyclizing) [Prolixibacteraceae bacterium]